MAFAIKQTAPASRLLLVVLLNLSVATCFSYTLSGCISQWRKIAEVTTYLGVDSPLVNFMLMFFRFTVASSVFCACAMIISLYGLIFCFGLSRIVGGSVLCLKFVGKKSR
jgi:hypothetical protein